MAYDVVVVGSINRDLTVRVPRRPRPGETVLGRDHETGPGGKGANQAVALARLGRRVALVGRVGDDAEGRALLSRLASEGVAIEHVTVDVAAGTGLALITLSDDGENAIVVSPGANLHLGATDVTAAAGALAGASVVLCQLEVPLETVAAAVAAGQRVVLNPAPGRPLPAPLLQRVDVLVPNRSELATLGGWDEAATVEEAADQAAALTGPGAIVVTLGGDGALLVAGDATTHVTAPEVDVVDTTGAGDAFCGALADAVCRGAVLEEAVRWAVVAGALATTQRGAQTALPTADQVAAAGGGPLPGSE